MPLTTVANVGRTVVLSSGTKPDAYFLDHSLGLDDIGSKAVDPSNGNMWIWLGESWFQTHIAGIPVAQQQEIGRPDDIASIRSFARFLSDTGNGPMGNMRQTVDGSVTPQSFTVAPAADELLSIVSVVIHIQDSGSLDAGKYGNNITLTNGITFRMAVGLDLTQNVVHDMMMNIPVKTNGDWGRMGAGIIHTDFGSGDNYISVRRDLTHNPVIVNGSLGHTFGILIRDNLTNLKDHTVFVEGDLIKLIT